MTTEPLHPTSNRLQVEEHHRAWARTYLDLEPSLDATACQARALKALETADFEVHADFDRAVKYLAGGPETLWTAADEAHSQQLTEKETEQVLRRFYNRYYSLPPQLRKHEYERLKPLCEPHPRLKRLLNHLERGLNLSLNVDHVGTEYQRYLGDCILRSYATWPTEKGRFYREKIVILFDRANEWHAAAQMLKRQDPRLASLGGNWFQELLNIQDPHYWYRMHFPDLAEKDTGLQWVTPQKGSFFDQWGCLITAILFIISLISVLINR
ncbi:hypothetical protein Spb1_37720 [Planctopirus ephydatiae]|uniref:Uncharacterized protein n=1 Tax=Planctopirus ephydatiae TaxID=2528019 RepID=A0A518GTA6_9PLAN|nr:hypothetical protein [Planctopirus ephydatiae]QDV31827.1 hypothetical protein Spb1_37720 [Planctopirus ephydatiae]